LLGRFFTHRICLAPWDIYGFDRCLKSCPQHIAEACEVFDEEGENCMQTCITLCDEKARIGILKIHHLLIIKLCIYKELRF
jgi:hypothetical protein